MEEYIREYKGVLFFIEEFQREIDILNHDINVYDNRIDFLDDEINNRLGNLEVDIKIFEDKKRETEFISRLENKLKNKFKIYLVSTIVCLLITFSFFIFNFLDVNIFMKFLTAISTSLTILSASNGVSLLIRLFRIRKSIRKCNLNDLNTKIIDRKKELKRVYNKNKSLLLEKRKLEKLVKGNYDKISDIRRKISCLNKEKNKLSNLLLESIHEDVINSYDGEIEGQLMIPGFKTLVRRNVDNM